MTRRTWQVWVAVVTGFAVSALLFHLTYMTRSKVLARPQFIGFFVCMFLRGVHSATKADYEFIALPINGVIYAAFILALLRIMWRAESN